jgi:N-acetylglucosaminylphosphatidylinositol deacetylase
MTKTWDEHKIASLLRSRYINEHIDVLITFDSQGVSSHPNHISLYRGARAFAASLIHMQGTDKRCPVDVYTLTSVSMLRKYTSLVDVFTTLYVWAKDTRKATMASGEDVQKQHPENLVFMNNLFGSSGPSRGVAWRAMTEAHQSQMRWFRYGWIVLSRYMLMNDLKLETVVVTN